MKIDIVKVANVVGMGLGFAGTIVSAWAGNKAMKANIANQVAKALADQANQH